MKAVNTAVLVMSLLRFTVEAPHCLQRHLVVPLLVVPFRFISPPQWQRGWFFDIATPHHAALSTSRQPHRGLNARDLDICPRSIYFPETYRSNPENRRFQTHFLSFNPHFHRKSGNNFRTFHYQCQNETPKSQVDKV